MKNILLFCLLAFCAPLWAFSVKDVTAGSPEEAKYLFEENSALREVGSDPFKPFIRVADRKMFYTYRFGLKKGRCAFLLLDIRTQFCAEASCDNKTWQKVCDFEACDTLAGLTLVDLTPFAAVSDTVYLRLTDKYPEDGWGALLAGFRLYTTDAAADVSRTVIERWKCGGREVAPGESVETETEAVFSARFFVPAGWKSEETALYIPGSRGAVASAKINGKDARVGVTWDRGRYITGRFEYGRENTAEITLAPEKGRAGIAAPARAGLRYTACATPSSRLLDGKAVDPMRALAPYTPDKMNYIAGNYLSSIYDSRYGLLGFNDNQEIHYLHDTARSMCALAEEERFTPVVRLELMERLYEGLKGGILPGEDLILFFKHDRRPVDIRPYGDAPQLTMVQKMDEMRHLCTIGPEEKLTGAVKDSPLVYKNGKWRFTRSWRGAGRSVSALCEYWLGDMDTPPSLTFSFDGKGENVIELGSLAENGFWFRPGSWGPEEITFPDGLHRAAARGLDIAEPDFPYIIISGGNGMGETDVPDQGAGVSLLVMWDKKPRRITARTEKGGRRGGVLSGLSLEFSAECRKAKIRVIPFMGYPNDQKAVIRLAENVLKTGRFGAGFYNPHASTFGDGIGADGFAAAAYIFGKYGLPEKAAEAKALAARALDTYIKYDQAESGSNQLYHLIKAVLYMHLAGESRFDNWGRKWADRIVNAQKEDGSWTWSNWQVRNMSGLISAWELTGDDKYLASVKKGLESVSYDGEGRRLWKGAPSADDFHGAGSFNIYGWLGDAENAQKAIDSSLSYISDGGFFRCSDLNPYMLGLSAKGLGLAKSEKKHILSLTESAVYDKEKVLVVPGPLCYTWNRFHPFAGDVDFPLDR
ncbi:MAG: hypothetical protein ILO36_04610 [Abditibacteriota bacterium]|nr:hypothetical protein [Abditibacteriota bacterium]